MGGYGSGRNMLRDTKDTVEDCRELSADALTRDKLLRPGVHRSGTLRWTRAGTGEQVSSCGFEVDTRDLSAAWLRLEYKITRTGEQMDYTVRLTHTKTPWGALRWWFVCPLVVGGRRCGRRAGKLYVPPGGTYYGCRHCYRLTYTSCQESHKNDAMFRDLARGTGMTPQQVKRSLANGW